jgi:quercetin dioxygenase-like cupin family protein
MTYRRNMETLIVTESTISKPVTLEGLIIRDSIQNLEEKMKDLPNALIGDSPEYLEVCPLTHNFAKGLYIRQITMPAGMLFVTKIHKFSHAAFILSGEVTLLEEEGHKRVSAPASFITKAGTKRIVFTHKDTVWTTVHATDKTDLKEIEDEIIAKDFDTMEVLP